MCFGMGCKWEIRGAGPDRDGECSKPQRLPCPADVTPEQYQQAEDESNYHGE